MRRLGVFLVAAALVGLVAVSVAAGGKGGTDRPFKATLAGSVTWEYPGVSASNCLEVTTFTRAAGQAAHMGRVAYFGTHCPDEPANATDGKFALTAANGDKLYSEYDYDVSSESNEIPITFTGGTGRFMHAYGTAVMTYDVMPQFSPGCNPVPDPWPCFDFDVPWPWWATITGTISY